MNPNDAAAIAAVCAALVGLATVVGQVMVSRQVHKVHTLVDGMAARRVRRARAEGVASVAKAHPGPLSAPHAPKWPQEPA